MIWTIELLNAKLINNNLEWIQQNAVKHDKMSKINMAIKLKDSDLESHAKDAKDKIDESFDKSSNSFSSKEF